MAELFKNCPACGRGHGIPVGESKPPGATQVNCCCGTQIFQYAPEPVRDTGGMWIETDKPAA